MNRFEDAFESHSGMTIAEAEARLRALYAELNRTKFNNELPENVYIKISLQAVGKASAKRMTAFGDSIFFDPFMKPVEYREVMTHEMCHLAADEGHGPPFQAKLKEVGKGEPWLRAQLKQCAEWVRHDRINLEWGKHAAELPLTMWWIDARREIARRIGCKVREFDYVFRARNRESFKDFWLRVAMDEQAKKQRPQQNKEGKF